MSDPRRALWFDLSTCTGCRACQGACKDWNRLPGQVEEARGSYSNPERLSASTWMRVQFVEAADELRATRWLFQPDLCKHCFDAPCLQACPSGAIERTSSGIVRIDPDTCQGNGFCVPACPYDAIHLDDRDLAQKCDLCESRVGDGGDPACAAACPTGTIHFGPREELMEAARARLGELHSRERYGAQIYGERELGGLGVFYLLMDNPETYGLPLLPERPTRRFLSVALSALSWLLLGLLLGSWAWKVAR